MNTVTIETDEYLDLLKARKYFVLLAPLLDNIEKLVISDGEFTNNFVKAQRDLQTIKDKIRILDSITK